ncbi:MAG: DUF29 domain-containing protein [Bryobacteraceae bacterium]
MQSQVEKTAADRASLYDQDFFEWTQRNADLLRAGQFDQADIEHIAEEIEDMGKRDLREIHGRMQVLLIHLLKCRFQPEKNSRSWVQTISEQRRKLDLALRDSPSLQTRLQPNLRSNYRKAAQFAAIETGLPSATFPAECPFTVEQILDPEYLP